MMNTTASGSFFELDNLKETLRIKGDLLQLSVVVAEGKDGDHFVAISPTLQVSGYGQSELEAREAFDDNMNTFCEDLLSLSPEKRILELIKLGFSKQKYRNKNYSKAFVDENGVLQDFEPGTLKTSLVTATV